MEMLEDGHGLNWKNLPENPLWTKKKKKRQKQADSTSVKRPASLLAKLSLSLGAPMERQSMILASCDLRSLVNVLSLSSVISAPSTWHVLVAKYCIQH